MKKTTGKKVVRRAAGTKKSSGAGHVLEGAFVGTVLGLAAGVLLAPKSGKQTRNSVKRSVGEFYSHVAPQIKKVEKMSVKEYEAVVREAAKNYGIAKKLTAAEEKRLHTAAKKTWGRITRAIK